MMPTMASMDEIKVLESYAKKNCEDGSHLQAIIEAVCAAARRGVEASICPDCHNTFKQPFKCVTCGAQKLYDATLLEAQQRAERAEAELAALKMERDELRAAAASLSADVSALGGELEALKAAQTDQRGPDAQDNAGAGIDAASQARCEHSGPLPKGESDE